MGRTMVPCATCCIDLSIYRSCSTSLQVFPNSNYFRVWRPTRQPIKIDAICCSYHRHPIYILIMYNLRDTEKRTRFSATANTIHLDLMRRHRKFVAKMPRTRTWRLISVVSGVSKTLQLEVKVHIISLDKPPGTHCDLSMPPPPASICNIKHPKTVAVGFGGVWRVGKPSMSCVSTYNRFGKPANIH